jgi:hypothetical protein
MAAQRARRFWLAYWRLARRYHRYEVVGEHHLHFTRPALLVGYHGRPIAHDLCMLQSYLYEQTGRSPRAFIHGGFSQNRLLRAVSEGMEFLTGDPTQIREALQRGDLLMVTPGGTREGCRSLLHRYTVDWGTRRGYLKFAIEHGLPIVPAAASGVDDLYLGLNNGDVWSKRLKFPHGVPAWAGLGPLGLWPLSPPFPFKVVQHIGTPIVTHLQSGVHVTLELLHREVVGAVQRLLDSARTHCQKSPQQAR